MQQINFVPSQKEKKIALSYFVERSFQTGAKNENLRNKRHSWNIN